VLSSYLSTLSLKSSSPGSEYTYPQLPGLEKVLQKKHLNVLELGAGCGIVGISLAATFPQISKVLLTDLPEATEIIEKNLTPSTLPFPTSSKLSHQVLDWSSPLPSKFSSTNWDLVVVADCTYNPDVVPDLVQTLKRLAEGNKGAFVLLAMKVRHESEMVFFDLMSESGFAISEKCKIPLPVLGGEEEEIDIFGFGYGK
jgi:predicted nicotinamide N-methyase